MQLHQATLGELEAKIESGLKTFIEVGLCLLEIRDKRLYKEQGYSRFEDYCQGRWGFSRIRAHQLIEGAEVSRLLTIVNTEPPRTESQARELAPLIKANKQEAIETWRQLQGKHGPNLTAQIIKEKVQEKLKSETSISSDEEDENGCWNCRHNKHLKNSDDFGFYCESHKRILYYDGNLYSDECWELETEEEIQVENKPHISYNSGNNEWYTPSEYIEAARSVMGKIELDPASSELANETVQAGRFFTVQDDGLKQGWSGKVWMNPPYSSELIGQFCNKLASHYSASDITEAIVLVNNATETTWFNALVENASAIIFPKARVKFRTPNEETGAPLQGQAVIYFGDNPDNFMDEFKHFGWGAYL